MAKLSAGILLYRIKNNLTEVFLVHPGGPFWAKKSDGAWSVPKGEYTEGEDVWQAATREFKEETGHPAPDEQRTELGQVKYSNKQLVVWAVPGDIDPAAIKSNTFTMEWPPKSGQQQQFPEVDKAGWFDLSTAERKLVKGQTPLIERLREQLNLPAPDEIEQLSLF